ncbi:hypothetical protein V490_02039, partial [Pseudogymnoascus sp. VKM F-3557]
MGQDTKHDNPDKKPQPPAQGGMYPHDLVMLVGALLHWCCVPSFDEGRGTSCQPMRTPHDLDSRSLPTYYFGSNPQANGSGMTDKNAAPPQDADRKTGDGSTQQQEGAQKHPLRPAMAMAFRGDDGGVSPKSGPTKVVSIEEPKLSPPMQPLDTPPIKQFTAGVGRRLTGRPTPSFSNSSKNSLLSQASLDEDIPRTAMSQSGESSSGTGGQYSSRHKHHHHQHDKLLSQVSEWLHVQKAKKAARKARKHKAHPHEDGGNENENHRPHARRESQDSCLSTISLEDLQSILEDSKVKSTARMGPESPTLRPRRPSYSSRKYTSRRYSVNASSDTEYFDGDVIVPSCDVVLDNSKTLNYASGATTPTTSGRRDKEAQVWVTFKSEILRLAHTLRLKGWRRVPLDSGADLEVERLSGALTNAVYVVSPPELPSDPAGKLKTRPAKLLLRIYGPQVEHLIDRDAELGILSRLARKKIGPRLLGTFRNGRFEEYFMSTTLTPKDLRDPETSKQIAKRMRELHDGIELLETERDEGPFVWRNWDKWVERCEHVISFLDTHPETGSEGGRKVPAWRERGLVCGVEWEVFREMVERYRGWLNEKYGGVAGLREKLVFAHNDTQYGNILRLLPTTESPLLLPANTHKQLVVIDFEYASGNTPGLEFANHFTEWCYNYHDPSTPYICNTKSFPTPAEQRRFIRAYLNHRPQFSGAASASATPKVVPSPGPGNAGISAFMLDSRGPPAQGGYAEEERRREAEVERRVEELMVEARWWRIANSAQWVAWGIVQANIPELEAYDAANRTPSADAPGGEVEG